MDVPGGGSRYDALSVRPGGGVFLHTCGDWPSSGWWRYRAGRYARRQEVGTVSALAFYDEQIVRLRVELVMRMRECGVIAAGRKMAADFDAAVGDLAHFVHVDGLD